jgi:hypothetical protein
MERLRTPKLEDPGDDDEDSDAGEEFTHEDDLASARKREKDGEWDVALPERTPRQKKQGSAGKVASWVVIISLVGGFGSWWRKEKIEIGYCGVGKANWSLTETKVPDWADVLQPQCEPCPQHAFCYPDFEVRCEHDFVLKPHPLSLGGLVPLPPTCEPDGEKVRRVKAVADKAVEELRERRAKWECGELAKENKNQAPTVPEPELKEEVGKKRRKGMSEEQFEDLWKGALGEILGQEEVTSEKEG